ncbi:urease accessory protein UreE [Psychrobacter sp.]|uniref:urease accessory protein UreE n=1 Tax=Psychrobacter sp. TaxID=56811 RepID=UPI0025EA7E62|nr:urease accessory protein UreE [Psychrobacter sp.]
MKIFTQRLDSNQLSTEQLARLDSQKQNKNYLYLDFDTRQRSRFKTLNETQESIGIDLPRTETLKSGCVLSNQQGDLIQVLASNQPLICVTADDDFTLMKGAYHLGNRHVPLMITPKALYFEPDHVLEAMLQNLGLYTEQVQAPFEPETGAYKGGHSHVHSDSHAHAHSYSDDNGHSTHSHSHD